MSKKKNTLTTAQIKQVRTLIQSLLDAFEDAYNQRSLGATEEQMMIQVDIFAANHQATNPGQPESILIAHRRAAQSGAEAADAGVPMILASTIMRKHLNASAQQILNQCNTN